MDNNKMETTNSNIKVIAYKVSNYEKDGTYAGTSIRKKPVEMSNTKRYHNCLYLLADLTACQRSLMDWLCEIMTKDNVVFNTIEERARFISYLEQNTNGKVLYSDGTVRNAFSVLVNKGLLIYKGRSIYKVNPEFFFKEDERNREQEIRLILEFGSIPIKKKGPDYEAAYRHKIENDMERSRRANLDSAKANSIIDNFLGEFLNGELVGESEGGEKEEEPKKEIMVNARGIEEMEELEEIEDSEFIDSVIGQTEEDTEEDTSVEERKVKRPFNSYESIKDHNIFD